MSEVPENSLALAASAYLRAARHQPVDWMEWGASAFARAEQDGKLILLDIGASWCHWCHVMDRESYEDPDTAAILSDHFIAIKVDRDERPEVDARYQAAVQAISGQGGWPLTAFLTPDGKPFFGGGYFPPDERYGRPSFQRVLLTMVDAFRTRRDEVNESAASIMAAIEQTETFTEDASESGRETPIANGVLLGRLLGSLLDQFDERNGGFGSQPKFPHAGVLGLLVDASSRKSPQAALSRRIAPFSLCKMAEGGVYDQLAGGFHRYSVDERWVVPHFEKMSCDNAELLMAFVHAFQTFFDPQFAGIAQSIVGWMDEILTDRQQGGFYASQDADVSPEDDGDYFTWTLPEVREVLSAEELAVTVPHFAMEEIGDMQHNPAKNVLRLVEPVSKTAAVARLGVEETKALLQSATAKLKAARLLRATPPTDKTIYTGWNAVCVSAYLAAARVLQDHAAGHFALQTLDRVLSTAWDPALGLAHVVAYGEPTASVPRLPAGLEAYATLGAACLDAWDYTGQLRFFDHAKALADTMVARFYDDEAYGFFDTERIAGAAPPLGALAARRKPLQDSPMPAGNPLAAVLLLRLEALSGNEEGYGTRARQTLRLFAGLVEHISLYAAGYGLALTLALYQPVLVIVIGDDDLARDLEATALARYLVNKRVLRLTHDQTRQLPPLLAASLPSLREVTGLEAGSHAFVLLERQASAPIHDPDVLIDTLNLVLNGPDRKL